MQAGRNRLQSETQSGSNHRRLSVPDAVSLVNGAAEEPSAFIIQMFRVPFEFAASVPSNARAESNTILLPSGSQIPGTIFRGWTAVSLVSEVAPEPSAFITQMFEVLLALAASLPSRARVVPNAILLPPGDQTGAKLSAPLAVNLVIGVAPEPSGFTTQMFSVALGPLRASLPSKARLDENAILLPFGDHAIKIGFVPMTVSLVTGVAPEPSAFITQMFGLSLALRALLPSKARPELNAILLPSGDQAGAKLLAMSLVSGVAPEPSGFTTQMFSVPPLRSLPSKARLDENAILLSSGDQADTKLYAPLAVSLVTGMAPEPSAFITQMLKVTLELAASLPSKARLELNAILVPSVDRTGPKLSALLAVSFVSGVVPEPSAFTTQTLKVWLGALMASLPSKARPEPNVIVIAFRGGGGPEVAPPQPARSHTLEKENKNNRDFFMTSPRV